MFKVFLHLKSHKTGWFTDDSFWWHSSPPKKRKKLQLQLFQQKGRAFHMSHSKMHVILLLSKTVTNLFDKISSQNISSWSNLLVSIHISRCQRISCIIYQSVSASPNNVSRHVLQATLVPALDTTCKTIKQYPTNVINGMDPWEKTTTLALPFLPCFSYSFSTVLWWFEVLGESWYFTALKQVSHLGGYNYTKVTLFFFKVVFGPGMSRNNTAVIFFAILRLCNRLWSAAKG